MIKNITHIPKDHTVDLWVVLGPHPEILPRDWVVLDCLETTCAGVCCSKARTLVPYCLQLPAKEESEFGFPLWRSCVLS